MHDQNYHGRRRSISKGKGLSIMQSSHILGSNMNINNEMSSIPSVTSLNSINNQISGQLNKRSQQRAINICEPVEFNRTAIISRNNN